MCCITNLASWLTADAPLAISLVDDALAVCVEEAVAVLVAVCVKLAFSPVRAEVLQCQSNLLKSAIHNIILINRPLSWQPL